MRQRMFMLVFVAFFVCSACSVYAGHFVKNNAFLFLDGKINIRFDDLQLGWSRDDLAVDHLRYEMTCLNGKAILNNVEYLDSAVDGQESVRWQQASGRMNQDFSSRFGHLDKQHRIQVAYSTKLKIIPYSLDNAKVRFSIFANGRDFKIFWIPKTGQIYASW
ncbi:MAG: hypothetical protein HQM09_15775 [Candidatus Riflebacteria bacterium]|nr:hypothetical protein [Candidatus Riflebacteria bacterium]